MTDRDPETTEANEQELFAQASRAFNSGDIRQAETLCRRILGLNQNHSQAAHMMGLIGLHTDHIEEGFELLIHAVRVDPGNVEAFCTLGTAYRQAGNLENATGAFEKVLQVDPGHATAHYYLGLVQSDQGNTDRALEHYQKVLERTPLHADALANIAQLLEQRNELDEARVFAERALEADPQNSVAGLTLGQIYSRTGALEEAVTTLQNLLGQTLSPRNRSLAFNRLGATQDKLGKYAEAFQSCRDSNDALLELYRHPLPEDTNVYSLASIERLMHFFENENLTDWTPYTPKPGARQPVFLLGFPRSGTTLLDQTLASHPQLYGIEEQETLQDIYSKFAASEDGLRSLPNLSTEEIEHYRESYWQRIDDSLPDEARGRIIVDKLPLNSIFIGLIYRFFPDAKYLLAIRDPRDVCLSCFMQTFKLEGPMGYFLTLENTALFYSKVMDLALHYVEQFDLNLLETRYEQLVGDFDAEAQRILSFLGVPWDDGVRRFHETAKHRPISTPSYTQVTQPLYASSVGRWRNYRMQLTPILPDLARFTQRLGYPAG